MPKTSKPPTSEQIELADEIFLSTKIPQPMPMDRKSCRKYIGKYAPLYFQRLRPALKEYKELRKMLLENQNKAAQAKTLLKPASMGKRPFAYSKDFSQKVIDYYMQNEKNTLSKTANHFGIAISTVSRWAREHNIIKSESQSKRYSQDEKKAITDFYKNNNVSLVQTARHFNATIETVLRFLRHNHVSIRKKGYSQKELKDFAHFYYVNCTQKNKQNVAKTLSINIKTLNKALRLYPAESFAQPQTQGSVN